MTNFKTKYLNNEVTIKDLDKYIGEWHKKGTSTPSLQDFLGFTDEEFTAFAHGEKQIKKKLDAIKSNQKYENTGSFLSKINSRVT
jgi:hypothetical protein